MMEITPVSVEFSALVIRHLDAEYGARRMALPAFAEFMDLLGQAEAVYQTLPEVEP